MLNANGKIAHITLNVRVHYLIEWKNNSDSSHNCLLQVRYCTVHLYRQCSRVALFFNETMYCVLQKKTLIRVVL